MTSAHVEQLRALGARVDQEADRLGESEQEALASLERATATVARSWSGSSLGYHANVYYAKFTNPPPGMHFSSEWGFDSAYGDGTSGDWREMSSDDVKEKIRSLAGRPDLSDLRKVSAEVAGSFGDERSRFESLVSSASPGGADSYIAGLLRRAQDLHILSGQEAVRAQLPTGSFISRDSVAVSAGLRSAPHQEMLAEVVSLRSPFVQARALARLCYLAADHLALSAGHAAVHGGPAGTKVFIGHGRSAEWRKLKDFVQDRLGLPWDEFNRVPVAGVTNIARLQAMLSQATVAFLVMTAEDEQADGTLRARENVVHEAGLFQGRLGFTRAIVMLEDECEPFSNIDGLGQLRFPKGRIEAVFEDVRAVLEREEIVPPLNGTS